MKLLEPVRFNEKKKKKAENMRNEKKIKKRIVENTRNEREKLGILPGNR